MTISSRIRLSVTAVLCLFVAACSSDNTTPPSTPVTPTCTIAATAATTSYAAAGGSGSVAVTTASGCAWTATSGAAFITITAGATGSGNGTVSYTVAANTGAARTGTLTVGGTALSISQAAGTPVGPTGTLGTPTANSPTSGISVPNGNPTLIVNNAAATGNVGTVTYRFEVSDQPSFPNDPARTFTADGIPQGSGSTTSWPVNRTLGNDVLWYWRARATNGTVTSDYSATETFRTPTSCTYAISPTTLNINSTSATATINVTTGSNCSWTATTSSSSFITILSGASGTGSGSVFISIPSNTGPQRTGTVTIGGQTLSVNQAGASVTASFQFQDSGTSGSAPVTECLIRSASTPTIASTCVLQSTSVPLTGSIASYTWQVQYGYGARGPFTITGNFPTFTIQEMCGQAGATDDGAVVPVLAILTVTDSAGNTATAQSGSGNQPPLTLRVYNCGK
jgi:hypothetical protein